MASPISCISILVIPLLVTSLFYHVSNADQALIESICKEIRDKAFCIEVLLSNPQSSTANLSMLGIITVDLNLDLFDAAATLIPKTLASLNDPLDKSRLLNCQTNLLTDARGKVSAARNAAKDQSYAEELNLNQDAFVNIANCANAYADPPKRDSPISSLTDNMVTLLNMSNQIIAMLT